MAPYSVYQDQHLEIVASSECLLPGYYIVFVTMPCKSLIELPVDVAKHLVVIIRALQQTIQQTISPEKIYTCCFAELNPQLHYHLFPRTQEVTRQFLQTEGLSANAGIDGAKLFTWAKAHYHSDVTDNEWEKIHAAFSQQLHANIESAFCHDNRVDLSIE